MPRQVDRDKQAGLTGESRSRSCLCLVFQDAAAQSSSPAKAPTLISSRFPSAGAFG